jgi:Zn-dependent metalloprotease
MRLSRRFPAVGASLAVAVMALAGAPAMAVSPASAAPVSPREMAANNAQQLISSRPSFLHASANDQFAAMPVQSSAGLNYVPYERTYRGLPVIGGDFVIVTNGSGDVLAHSEALQHTIGDLSTAPTLTVAAAEGVAKGQLRSVTRVEGTRLIVNALGNGPARLAYSTTLQGTGPEGYSRLTVTVDALTGAVLGTHEHVMHGNGSGAWNGPSPIHIDTTQSGSTFSMLTPNFNNMPCQDAANNTTFTKTTDNWGNGNATSRETGCVDALFGAQKEIQMLSTWVGRNGMDGVGGAWPIRVGLNQVNAFYDGTQVQIGHNTAGQWIGALDVIGHEMGHGVDDHTPGGISQNGTQEWIADVFGVATEFWANESAPYAQPDFLVGEQVNLTGTGPIRNMYHPSLINGDPDCYSSNIPNTEVHAAAGPGNHWFYLLAEGTNPGGGLPSSPTCNGSGGLTGIGVNALKILYNAMLMKTSASSYLAYRFWTLTAAKNLDSTCGLYNSTRAAWDAISVPAQAGEPTCFTGTVISLRAHANNKIVTAENAGASSLIANRTAIGPWEEFDLINNPDGSISLRAHANNMLVTAENAGSSPLIANRTAIGPWEEFDRINNPDGSISLRAHANNMLVTAENAGSSPLIANRTAIGPWEEFDLIFD